ncbi:hypothetical protein [Fluviicola taffensis]|uniref:Lipoprotein n=1 Tax=Fluviicola taffensis (strain DSM 16823 / NCIMB 13979 / RW262) TaxID=755732 RepID=F2IAT1_FLUTR|nr:hypothetical protein [Fluviicola taffensis]AEA44236.1 hypothetical protein Fluta_2250 [Fluviicola taffensis DSM 16823]
MKIIILTLLYLTTISSCGLIHYMGTKPFMDKTRYEVETYLAKNNIIYYDHSILMKDELIDSLSAKKHALDLYKLEKGTMQSQMQLRIYDSLGKLINGYCQCYGDMNRLNILSEKGFKKFEHLPTNYELKFKDNLSLWNINESEEQRILLGAQEKKYTIVIYWNIWSNHYSKIMLKKLKEYLLKFEMKNEVLIILVNDDGFPSKK